MKALHEIILVLAIILIHFMNREDCLFGLCFGISFTSGIYFVYWLYSSSFYFFIFFFLKIKKLQLDLDKNFSRQKFLLRQTETK